MNTPSPSAKEEPLRAIMWSMQYQEESWFKNYLLRRISTEFSTIGAKPWSISSIQKSYSSSSTRDDNFGLKGASMMASTDSLERIADDPRVRIRKAGLNAEARCVLYWMRRSQRGRDNPALNVAIQADNVLKKPVLVFFGLNPNAHHANLRHYTFLAQGLRDLTQELRKRNVGFILRSYSEHDILKFCSEVRPCLVVADENPLRGSERAQAKAAAKLNAPFWSVDSDV